MKRRRVLATPILLGLAACLDTTDVGTEVARITLSAHSDTVWSIGARTRIVATGEDAFGNAVTLIGAEWSSTAPDVATVEPGFARPVGEGSTLIRVFLAGVAAELPLTVRDEVRFTVSQELAESFQWSIEDTLTARGVVGMTASVLMDDGTRWSGSAGWNAPGEERMSPSLTFPIASVTKSFVTAAALLLAQEGVLSLEHTIGDWLSPIDHVAPDIGLRLLMSQTSGLGSFGSHPEWGPAIDEDLDRSWTPDELLARFMTPPLFVPGERYASSATNMFLTGMIVREAAGRPLSETLRSRLIDPLGLTHTSFPAEEALRGSPGRLWTVSGGALVETTFYETPAIFTSRWASSGVYSRAADLVTWGRALFGQEFLNAGTTGEMLQFRPTGGSFPIPGLGAQDGSGLGVRRYTLNGRTYYGHSGASQGAATELLFDPDTGITTAVIVNQSPGTHDFVHFRAAFALMEMARASR